MHLRARLDEATLQAILDELLPVTIRLDTAGKDEDGDDADKTRERWIQIEPTHVLDFVAGKGLRLATRGRIRWFAAGLPIDATLHELQVLLRPEIVADPGGGKLVFHAEVEAADLKNVPALFDRGIVALLNRRLDARTSDLVWNFGRSLDLTVPMPAALEGVADLKIDANGAVVEVLADAFELGINVSLHFRRRTPPSAARES